MLTGAPMPKKTSGKTPITLTSRNADRHVLYQKSVQAPDFEVELITDVFRRRTGRKPLTLREDFCGTALLCAEWVSSDEERTALGIDIDRAVLAWGKKHNIAPLGKDAKRVELVRGDVRDSGKARHDVVVAFNYSYFCFKDRATLRGYFEAARRHVADGGIFLIDLFGGYESGQVMEEKRRYGQFTYVWHQAAFNPITNDFTAHIHFNFRDGSAMRKAFTYEWRLWTIPELRELLAEAGFDDIECLWEGEDEKGEGNGEFRPRKRVDWDAAYNAYLVSSPKKSRR
jgi:SAM-dependent methyltransferase